MRDRKTPSGTAPRVKQGHEVGFRRYAWTSRGCTLLIRRIRRAQQKTSVYGLSSLRVYHSYQFAVSVSQQSHSPTIESDSESDSNGCCTFVEVWGFTRASS